MPSLRVASSVLAIVGAAAAQCELQQIPVAQPSGGVNGVATAGGTTYITGYFVQQGVFVWNGVAQATGSGWFPLGNGLQGVPPWATFPPVSFGAAAEAVGGSNTSVVIGGQFVTAGGVTANGIARYNGVGWSSMGGGADGMVRALAADGQGGVYAGGDFTTMDGLAVNRVAHWDGASWSTLGSGVSGSVRAMAVMQDSSLMVAGTFQFAGSVPVPGLARWDGSVWSTLPGISLPTSFAYSLASSPNGDLFVGGAIQLGNQPSSLARWDGSSWQSLLPGASVGPRALDVLPDGSLIVQSPSGLSRWQDGQWRTLANVTGTATAIGSNSAGQLHVGGVFSGIGSAATAYVARFETPCPAQVGSAGGGCTWSNGFSVLEAKAPAWIGGSYRARCFGMPPNAVAASVYGFAQTTTSLGALLPMASPLCFSHTSADFVELAVPNAGALETDEPLPNDPALQGASFYHQLVIFELDTQGACVGVSATNTLELILGVF